MILGFFNRRKGEKAAPLYASIVAQARQPVFYRDWSVADTVEGRFEMVVLHLVLVTERLRAEDGTIAPSAQALFDFFLLDMDRSLREMGVGDLSVGKRMKKIGQQVYGRFDAFRPGLAAGDEASLSTAIDRNVFADGSEPEAAGWLATYAVETVSRLASQPTSDIESGRIDWPEPSQTLRRSPA
ncbi:ubiquinol-cytochrome C chaperone family protein [Amorphus orientalis]|uniref:Cytochrome b pre-mRNA-processing protein 3 n=1 Tax=Amorphus orientalis TaxID=649198 RepID=A0AAE3VQ10_9HYPH|nr:ubiquinol-cytochrome C chaperone family protein [Amorphus orientalis]MDQ0316040.1 cytochrome b pre-mRNA-processing protein 3 [Amorphus orientalis]